MDLTDDEAALIQSVRAAQKAKWAYQENASRLRKLTEIYSTQAAREDLTELAAEEGKLVQQNNSSWNRWQEVAVQATFQLKRLVYGS